MSNVVVTLAATNSEVIAGSAIQRALEMLQDPALLRVSRDEYFTYLTPQDELYDKSVVPGSAVFLSFHTSLPFRRHFDSVFKVVCNYIDTDLSNASRVVSPLRPKVKTCI